MIQRINPRSRADQYGSRINRDHSPLLVYTIPSLSILLGSLIPALPIAAVMPFLPPIGFMILIGWRLMRPGLLPLWAGVPFGMFDDLFSGQPFGSAIFLWSLAMIGIELFEARYPWSGFWQNWLTAGLVIGAYLVLMLVFSGTSPSIHHVIASGPQFLLSILLYPIISRMVAWFDRLRLLRLRRLA